MSEIFAGYTTCPECLVDDMLCGVEEEERYWKNCCFCGRYEEGVRGHPDILKQGQGCFKYQFLDSRHPISGTFSSEAQREELSIMLERKKDELLFGWFTAPFSDGWRKRFVSGTARDGEWLSPEKRIVKPSKAFFYESGPSFFVP